MNDIPNDLVIITTTSDDRAEVEKIATVLVQEKLAACCQISEAIQSIYMWQGKVTNAKEFSCAIKTREQHVETIKSKIRQMHKYDVPQIVAVKAIDVCCEYLSWVHTETEG